MADDHAHSEPAPRQQARILLLASVFHILADGIYALLYPLLPTIASELRLSYGQASLLRATFTISGAVFQVPAGMLAEKTGEFIVLTVGNLWLAAGLAGMGLTKTFIPILLLALAAGIGGNAQHPVATSLISRVYERRGRSKAIGTLNFTGDVGKLVAPLFAGFVAVRYGWRAALITSGLVGVGIVVALWLATRGAAAAMSATMSKASASAKSQPLAGNVPETTGRSSQAAFVMLNVIGILDSSVRGSTLTLLPFVLAGKGFGTEAISAVFAVIYAGGAAGKFICGWIAERFGTMTVIWVTEAATTATAVLFLVTPVWAIVPLAILFGFSLNGTSSVLYAAVAPLAPPERRGRAYGIYYTTTLISSALAPVIYGSLGDAIGLLPAYTIAAAVTLAILPLSGGIRQHLLRA